MFGVKTPLVRNQASNYCENCIENPGSNLGRAPVVASQVVEKHPKHHHLIAHKDSVAEDRRKRMAFKAGAVARSAHKGVAKVLEKYQQTPDEPGFNQ